MGASLSTLSTVSMAGQGFGAGASAVGAYYSSEVAGINADMQRSALEHQASMDLYNARSQGAATRGQADLNWLGAQSEYQVAQTSATITELKGQQEGWELRANAQLSALQAQDKAYSLTVGAEIDDQQARLYELQAQAALLNGQQREQDSRLQYAQAKSKATASMAARGIDIGEGSALAVRNSSDLLSERAAIQIQQNTVMQAFGNRVQASNAQLSAAGKRYQAGMALTTSGMQTSLADSRAQFAENTASADARTVRALAGAGLLNAQATRDYSHAMAGIAEQNATAASMVRRASATGLSVGTSPWLAAGTSLITSGTQMARSWYDYNKQTK